MNPYPKTKKCEDSGQIIPNPDYKIWEEGARFVVEWLRVYAEKYDMVIDGFPIPWEDWRKLSQEIGID